MSANAETSDRLIGATVTVVLHALLFVVFLLLVVSVEIPDKPEGDGNTLEVSYGMDALGSGLFCHLYGGGNGRIGEVGMAARRWIQPQSDRVYSILSCTRTARSARIHSA